MQKILLINENDHVTGWEYKLLVHQKGLLHRAFSVLIMNNNHEILLQQRAFSKYHSGGLWSNTCCGHFVSDQNPIRQAEQRLHEEMGLMVPLDYRFTYRYNVGLDHGMTENELVYAYTGICNTNPIPDSSEVAGWKWVDADSLLTQITNGPEDFTFWFSLIYKDFLSLIKKQ